MPIKCLALKIPIETAMHKNGSSAIKQRKMLSSPKFEIVNKISSCHVE